MKVNTAVLLAAGRGTRRLPITRIIDKAMLPIGNRPVVDYVVEQCVAAGITKLIFVVAHKDSLVERYYASHIDSAKEYPWLNVQTIIEVVYVVQDEYELGYGTASALASAKSALAETQKFVVVAADGFLYTLEHNVIQDLLDGCEADVLGSMVALEVPPEQVPNSTFSLIVSNERQMLTELIEKPTVLPPGQAPVVNISYYVLDQQIFPILSKLQPHNTEYYLTDAVVELSKKGGVRPISLRGEYLDAGQVKAWVRANQKILEENEY